MSNKDHLRMKITKEYMKALNPCPFLYRKYVNGAVGVVGDSDEVVRECNLECENTSAEDQDQLVSQLCREAMDLELSNPSPSLSVDALSSTSVINHSSANKVSMVGRDEQSDDEDEDTEITVMTEVTKSVDTVDSSVEQSKTTTNISENEGILNVCSSIVEKPVLSDVCPKTVWRTSEPEGNLTGQSVDSSTDTLVAPDQLANNNNATAAVTAPSLCNGLR